jgi:hypothetical protein
MTASRITDEALWRKLVHLEMELRGFTAEEIAAAERHTCKAFGCEWDWNHSAWDCTDEDGKSRHPVADEYEEIVGVIGRALEAAEPHLTPALDWDQVAKAIATKAMYYDSGTAVEQVDREDLAGLVAATDAVMALLNGSESEARCNCGFGGFHDDTNPRCDLNEGKS